MDVYERNNTKIYSLNSCPLLPEWLNDRAKRNISRRDPSLRRRIELLQDFAFPDSSTRLSTSPDGRYLLASGRYPPRISCFDFYELGKKFERYTDSDVVDIAFVGNNYGKFSALSNNRTVSFHAPHGLLSTIRLPTFGRAMVYERSSCMLLIASLPCISRTAEDIFQDDKKGGCVYRINLEEGRFSESLTFKAEFEVSGKCLAISPSHRLMAFGGEDGKVRFWDSRSGMGKKNLLPFCELNVTTSTSQDKFNDFGLGASVSQIQDIYSMGFDSTGVFFAVGTKFGKVALYDMRSSKPLYVQVHQYGMPVHTLNFHNTSGTLLSSDAKVVKIWRYQPSPLFKNEDHSQFDININSYSSSLGVVMANVEGKSNFTHFQIAGDENDPTGQSSGLLLCSGEQPRVQAFYVPFLGPAPRWCSFLDNITEELEEREHIGKSNGSNICTSENELIYDDYKFLTLSEIESLGIQSLVGTPLLRGYMHGFFINVNLYHRVRSVSHPFEYEEYRLNKIRKKIDDKVSSHILPKKLHNSEKTVNSDLVRHLHYRAGSQDNTQDSRIAQNMIADKRFKQLFNNPDFEIDEDDENFKFRHPSGKKSNQKYCDNSKNTEEIHHPKSKDERNKYITKRLNRTAIIRGAKKAVMRNITCESFDDLKLQEKAFNIGLGDVRSGSTKKHVSNEEFSLSIGQRLNQTSQDISLPCIQNNFSKRSNNHRIIVKGGVHRKEAIFFPMQLDKMGDRISNG